MVGLVVVVVDSPIVATADVEIVFVSGSVESRVIALTPQYVSKTLKQLIICTPFKCSRNRLIYNDNLVEI